METRTVTFHTYELDSTMERAEKSNRLEMEYSLNRKLSNDIEFYKMKIGNLLELNNDLFEAKESSEYELNSLKKRVDKVSKLQAEITECKQLLENMTLKCAKFNNEVLDAEESEHMSESILDQSASSAEAEILHLRMENNRLTMIIDSMERNLSPSKCLRIQELERENEEIYDKQTMLLRKNSDSEISLRLAKQENKFLQDSLKKQRAVNENQMNLESLYDQLNKDYTKLLEERDGLKTKLQDVSNELLALENSHRILKIKNSSLQNERVMLRRKIQTFSNLKEEHSRLKEDFKTVYTQCQVLITERRNMYEKNRSEISILKKKQERKCSYPESKIQYLDNHSKVLLSNSEWETTKKKLIEHFHIFGLQCKEVFKQITEEKENLYTERTNFIEKISQMKSQQKTLEEKISELCQNASSSVDKKEKSITSNFVTKMKIASCTFFGKNRKFLPLRAVNQQQTEQSGYENLHSEPSKTMTLDRRLSGKWKSRNRFSLGTFRRGNGLSIHGDSTNRKLFSEQSKILPEAFDNLIEEFQNKIKTFDVIKKTKETRSTEDCYQEKKDPDNNNA